MGRGRWTENINAHLPVPTVFPSTTSASAPPLLESAAGGNNAIYFTGLIKEANHVVRTSGSFTCHASKMNSNTLKYSALTP